MSTKESAGSKVDRTPANGYDTLQGVFEGTPPISYSNASGFMPDHPVVVGGEILSEAPVKYNEHRRTVRLVVRNTGDRPIQVGSHYHFFEVNRYMEFDRPAAFGYHLNIPATTAIRFEPGEQKEVELVTYGGKCRIIGFSGLTSGYSGLEDAPVYYPTRMKALAKMQKYGFKSVSEADAETESEKKTIKQ